MRQKIKKTADFFKDNVFNSDGLHRIVPAIIRMYILNVM